MEVLSLQSTTKRKKKANAVKRRARIRTSIPIPSDVKHFSFQIMANAESVGKDISFGYTTRNKSVLYEGENGLISKEFFDIDWDYTETYFWKNMYHKKEIENVEIIVESKNSKKSLYIEGVFLQGNIKNRNGRMYPMETLRREVSRYNESNVQTGRALGELGHPDGPTVNLDRVSHKIVSLKEN